MRWFLLIVGIAFLTMALGASQASAASGTYRIVAGGDQNWTPGSGAIDQTSSNPLTATGTLTGDAQHNSVGNADYELASGPGIVRAKLQGSFHTAGSTYPFNPSVQAISTTEITISGPSGVPVATSVNVHVDGFLGVPVCGGGGSCGALDVEIHAGSGVGSEFSSLGTSGKDEFQLSHESFSGGYHIHGDFAVAMTLPVNMPAAITIVINLSGRLSGAEVSTFDGNFDDPVALSQVSFAPTGPVLNAIPAGYTVSGPSIVNNHWSDPFAPPPPPADTTPPTVVGVPDQAANVYGWYNAPVTIDWQATDASGQASDPPNSVVTTEGKDVTVTSNPSCDASGNCASGTYTLSLDRTPPRVTCSDANPTFPVRQHDVAVIWVDVADDLSGGGGTQAIGGGADISSPGVKTIDITGSDFAGNQSTVTCTYTVVLSDTVRPVVTVPANIVSDATGPSGSPAVFAASAVDDVDPAPVVSCTPPSGSTFAIGTTTVVCSATDTSGNVGTASFTVTVRGADPQLAALSLKTAAYLGTPALRPAFQATLRAATIALASGRPTVACWALDLYIAEVRLAPARAFSPGERAALLADAMRIKAVLGCG